MINDKILDYTIPSTNWRVRCDRSNEFITPSLYDISPQMPILEQIEAAARPTKTPRFIHRVCATPTPVFHPASRQTGTVRLFFCIKGQALHIVSPTESHYITSGSFLLLPPKADHDMLLGRGDQTWITCYWEPDSPVLPSTDISRAYHFSRSNVSPILKSLTNQVVSLGGEAGEWNNLTVSWLNLILHERDTAGGSFTLGPEIDSDLANLQNLVEAIRETPGDEWSLTKAAEMAGYSPFHLSRIFRSSINVGLPKFVETCRSESAISQLLNGSTAISDLVEKCGFGTPQAFRAAIRENSGFLPSELRGYVSD